MPVCQEDEACKEVQSLHTGHGGGEQKVRDAETSLSGHKVGLGLFASCRLSFVEQRANGKNTIDDCEALNVDRIDVARCGHSESLHRAAIRCVQVKRLEGWFRHRFEDNSVRVEVQLRQSVCFLSIRQD